MRRWRGKIGDVVLQVTMRAAEPRAKPRSSPSSAGAPDAGTLGLSGSWAESNLRAGSPLSALMKRRVRECVEEAVLNIVLPPPASPASSPPAPSPSDAAERENDDGAATPPPPPSTSNGLEPLMPEIRHLAERAAKLVQIHTNVYGGLYANPSFLELDGDATAAAAALASATAASS